MARMRPGIPLGNADLIAAALRDAIDALELFQTPTPHPGLDDVLGDLRLALKLANESVAND